MCASTIGLLLYDIKNVEWILSQGLIYGSYSFCSIKQLAQLAYPSDWHCTEYLQNIITSSCWKTSASVVFQCFTHITYRSSNFSFMNHSDLIEHIQPLCLLEETSSHHSNAVILTRKRLPQDDVFCPGGSGLKHWLIEQENKLDYSTIKFSFEYWTFRNCICVKQLGMSCLFNQQKLIYCKSTEGVGHTNKHPRCHWLYTSSSEQKRPFYCLSISRFN